MSAPISIRSLFIAPDHAFAGRKGYGPADTSMVEVPSVCCRAGLGIEGDRFYGYQPDFKGQVTFFSWEVYEAARHHFRLPHLSPAALRRNVFLEGIDLHSLIGTEFSIGGIEFLGTDEAAPCYWMNNAIAPGAEAWLRGNCGLRVRVLSDGELQVGDNAVTVLAEQMALGGFGR